MEMTGINLAATNHSHAARSSLYTTLSRLPRFGDNHPVGRALRALGAKARTARPTLHSAIPAGMMVLPSFPRGA